jgi:hypothetical protein
MILLHMWAMPPMRASSGSGLPAHSTKLYYCNPAAENVSLTELCDLAPCIRTTSLPREFSSSTAASSITKQFGVYVVIIHRGSGFNCVKVVPYTVLYDKCGACKRQRRPVPAGEPLFRKENRAFIQLRTVPFISCQLINITAIDSVIVNGEPCILL